MGLTLAYLLLGSAMCTCLALGLYELGRDVLAATACLRKAVRFHWRTSGRYLPRTSVSNRP